jgi:arabinose-5-phosphate isomerase
MGACMNFIQRARSVLAAEIEALRQTRARLDEDFARAVETIVAALRRRGKLVVTGIGKSGNIGQKLAATFSSTGAPSVVLNSVDALHGDLGVISDGDVVLALSYTGETEELLRILPAIKRFDVRIIAMTGHPRSQIARYSDVVLKVHVPREACPFNLSPTSSTTAMLALGDALAMCVLQARGFKKAEFAKRHPAGAIGRTMLIQIKDIMRSGDRNPVIAEQCSVKDALLAMTRARSGTISVVGRNGRLAGVFTDGDLRRHMSRDPSVLEAPVRAVMTRRPIAIRQDALAVEALKMFEQRQIDDLIVVDDRRRPVGIVDSQDLPKFKIM